MQFLIFFLLLGVSSSFLQTPQLLKPSHVTTSFPLPPLHALKRVKPTLSTRPFVENSPSLSSSSSPPFSFSDRIPWLGAVLICSLAWGLNFPVSKLAFASPSLELAPGAFDVVRFGLATACIAPWLVESREQWKVGAELGLYLAIGVRTLCSSLRPSPL